MSYPQFVTIVDKTRQFIVHCSILGILHLDVFTIFSFLFNGDYETLQTGEMSWSPTINSISLAFLVVEALNNKNEIGWTVCFMVYGIRFQHTVCSIHWLL